MLAKKEDRELSLSVLFCLYSFSRTALSLVSLPRGRFLRATPAGKCSPIAVMHGAQVHRNGEVGNAHRKAENFVTKDAGNARGRVLAYPSLAFIQTIHSGEVDFAQSPM